MSTFGGYLYRNVIYVLRSQSYDLVKGQNRLRYRIMILQRFHPLCTLSISSLCCSLSAAHTTARVSPSITLSHATKSWRSNQFQTKVAYLKTRSLVSRWSCRRVRQLVERAGRCAPARGYARNPLGNRIAIAPKRALLLSMCVTQTSRLTANVLPGSLYGLDVSLLKGSKQPNVQVMRRGALRSRKTRRGDCDERSYDTRPYKCAVSCVVSMWYFGSFLLLSLLSTRTFGTQSPPNE